MPIWQPSIGKPFPGRLIPSAFGVDIPPPIFAYTFSEGAGKTVYDSVGGFPGTLTNGPTWVPSPHGPSISFTGTANHYVELNDPAGWQLSTGSFTVGAIFSQNGPAYGQRGSLISRGSVTGLDAVMDLSAFDDGVNWHFELYDGSSNPQAGGTYTDGPEWDVAFGVRDTKTGLIYLYIGGGQVNSTADTTGNMNASGQHWTIGKRADEGSFAGYFNGRIAAAFAWKTALSASTIRSLTRNFWRFTQPSPSYFLFIPATAVTISAAAVAASGAIGGDTALAIISGPGISSAGVLGAQVSGPTAIAAGVSATGALGGKTELVVADSLVGIPASSAPGIVSEFVIISETATSIFGDIGGSSPSQSGSSFQAAVAATGTVGSISVVAGSSIAINVSAVAAIAFPPGTSSWQQAKTLPASMIWLSIAGTSAIWQTLPIGATIAVAKYDGTTYNQVEAYTVGDGTLVDSSGDSIGVDSLWYWDVWAWANPATWLSIPGSYATWGSLPIGTAILAGKYDGTTYTNLDAFTVRDGTLIDPSGASTGVDSLWYWDLWSYVTSGVVADVIVEAGSVSGLGALGTTSIVSGSGVTITATSVSASGVVGGETAAAIVAEVGVAASGDAGAASVAAIISEVSVATSGDVGTITAGAGTIIAAAGVSASGIVGGGATAAIVPEASVATSGDVGTITAGAGTIIAAAGVSASGEIGGGTTLAVVSEVSVATIGDFGVAASAAIISEASVTTTGATGVFSIIAGTTLTVTVSAVSADGVVGSETVFAIISEATVVASGSLGVQTAGPAPVASSVSASGAVGVTSELQAIGATATSASGLLSAATAGPIVLSSGASASAVTGVVDVSLVIGEAAIPATGSTALISIFNGGVVTVTVAGVFAEGIAGTSEELIFASTLSVSSLGIPGTGSPQVTLYIKAYPDPFSSMASTQIDAYGSTSSEGIDPFGSSAGYLGN